MKDKKSLIFGTILVIAIVSSACYLPQIVSSEDMIATEVGKAVDDALEQTAEVVSEVVPTYTPYPTYTPAPTYTTEPYSYRGGPFYYNNGYYPSDGPVHFTNYCNKSEFLNETIEDNTIFSPGDTFTKTWTFMNVGQCTWTTDDYKFVLISGNSMGGNVVSALPNDVPPGGIVQLSVDFTAPVKMGTYKGNWAIVSDNGEKFSNCWVQIKVR